LPNNATLASTGTTGSATISTMADMTTPVGAYDIVVDSGDLASPNYTFNVVYGKMNITKALLTVSADLKIKLYGEDNPTLSVSITGFKNFEDSASSGLIGSPVLTTTATKTSPVGGNYTITVTAGTLSASNYSFTFKNSSMIIGKAVLRVIADNKSRTYGAANPAFTTTYDGFVLGQTYANSGVTGIPEYFTDAVMTSPVGTYGIGVSNGTLAANNYSFEFYAGTLTIDKAPLRVTADNKTRGYGSPDPVFTATYTGFVNGQTYNTSGIKGAPMLSTTADALSPLGTYPIIPDAGTMESSNYSFSFVNGSLTVGKANLVVRAENKSKVYGSGNPPLTYVVEGFVNNETLETSGVSGTATLSTTATNASVVGNYPITPAVGSLTATNYAFTFTNGSLTVGKAPLTVIADNKTR
ncbi:MAG: MBG domain-containing protein, partial [Chitinophagaceae bacterium]